jgi:hypothetical protein
VWGTDPGSDSNPAHGQDVYPFMTFWILVGLLAWCGLAVPVALLIGAVIRHRDGSRVLPTSEACRRRPTAWVEGSGVHVVRRRIV